MSPYMPHLCLQQKMPFGILGQLGLSSCEANWNHAKQKGWPDTVALSVGLVMNLIFKFINSRVGKESSCSGTPTLRISEKL